MTDQSSRPAWLAASPPAEQVERGTRLIAWQGATDLATVLTCSPPSDLLDLAAAVVCIAEARRATDQQV